MIAVSDARRLPLPDASVHCIVTSPPYFRMRYYEGLLGEEIGVEGNAEDFIATIRSVGQELARVLHPEGTLWINLADSYGGARSRPQPRPANGRRPTAVPYVNEGVPGCLMGIPGRVCQALVDDGWIHRRTVIWHKKTPVPETLRGTRWEPCKVKISGGYEEGSHPSKTAAGKSRGSVYGSNGGITTSVSAVEWAPCRGCPDCLPHGGYILRRGSWRHTASYEPVMMFSRRMGYFCDDLARLEPVTGGAHSRGRSWGPKASSAPDGVRANSSFGSSPPGRYRKRNRRDVLSLVSRPCRLEHFAAFPADLVRPLIDVSTSPAGACGACGSQWAPVLSDVPGEYRPTCACGARAKPAVVLDPFGGTGTVARAAEELGRQGVSLDLSLTYATWAAEASVQKPLPLEVVHA